MYSNVPIGMRNPGCMVILADQSWSTGKNWHTGTKSEQIALIVDRAISDLGLNCRVGVEIRDRFYVCIISYGETVDCVVEGMISDVYESPVETKKVKKTIPDGAGGYLEVEIDVPIWLQPRASGNTPMHKAFEQANAVLQKWIPDWPDSFPPIIVNITDGAPTNFDLTRDAARAAMNLWTRDGNVLVHNIYIANDEPTFSFPSSNVQFPDNPIADFFFSISSVLPGPLFSTAEDIGFSLEPGARCFSCNTREILVSELMDFGARALSLGPIESIEDSVALIKTT